MSEFKAAFTTPRDSLYFLHIPKTAGTSLRQWLSDLFSAEHFLPCDHLDDLKAMAPEDIRQHRFFSGHFSTHLTDFVAPPPATITWLREPVARQISDYHFTRDQFEHLSQIALSHGRHDWIEFWKKTQDLSLAELCQSEAHLGYSDNLQVRYLTGNIEIPDRVEINETILAQAKQKLAEIFHVGLCEQMDPSIDMLTHKLRHPYKPLRVTMNQGQKQNRQHDLSAAELRIIREANHYDLQLYQFAQQLFAGRLEAFWESATGAVVDSQEIIEMYRRPETMEIIQQHITNHFLQSHPLPNGEPGPFVVDFADAVFQSGWYPRIKMDNGQYLRRAGPGRVSRFFAPLSHQSNYLLQFKIVLCPDPQIPRTLKLFVDNSPIRLEHDEVKTREGQTEFFMRGFIPSRLIARGQSHSELRLESTHTIEQKVEFDSLRHISLSTHAFTFSPISLDLVKKHQLDWPVECVPIFQF